MKEAANLLGVNTSRVCHIIAANRLKATKLGRNWIISKKSFEHYQKHRLPRCGGRPKENDIGRLRDTKWSLGYWDTVDVAKHLDVSHSRAIQMCRQGCFESADKFNNDWIVEIKEVMDYQKQPGGRPSKEAKGSFGVELRAARLKSGMTMTALATASNISRTSINAYEYGRSMPRSETIKRLGEALGYSFKDICCA